jgi:hypothetical protein
MTQVPGAAPIIFLSEDSKVTAYARIMRDIISPDLDLLRGIHEIGTMLATANKLFLSLFARAHLFQSWQHPFGHLNTELP